jgi:hypothetical protein
MMKKILLIAIVLFGLQVFGQKKLEIYNLTTLSFDIYNIFTNASGSNPEFQSKLTIINIPPSGSYILENSSNIYRFPFLSPSTTPVISWMRDGIALSNTAAWVLGNAQVFDKMIFSTTGNYNVIGVASPSASGSSGGTAWTADYQMIVNPANPNDITYLVVIQ